MDDLKECREAFDAWWQSRFSSDVRDSLHADVLAFEVWQAAWNRRAVPQANAEQDAERINYLEAWNTKNKGKGFFWNTFSFSVSKTVREQLDESIRAASKTTPSSGEGE